LSPLALNVPTTPTHNKWANYCALSTLHNHNSQHAPLLVVVVVVVVVVVEFLSQKDQLH
jgi:hypothetical protein